MTMMGIVTSLPLPRGHDDGTMSVFARGLSVCGSAGGDGVFVHFVCVCLGPQSCYCMTRPSQSNPNALRIDAMPSAINYPALRSRLE